LFSWSYPLKLTCLPKGEVNELPQLTEQVIIHLPGKTKSEKKRLTHYFVIIFLYIIFKKFVNKQAFIHNLYNICESAARKENKVLFEQKKQSRKNRINARDCQKEVISSFFSLLFSLP